MSGIVERFREVQTRIAAAAARSGRASDEIQLIAVTKTQPVQNILEVIEAGVKVIGENRIQEALSKHPEIGDKVQWHLIGHLQKNKVKKALSIFDVIHSVDSLELAEEISKQASRLNKCVEVLLQVNVSGEVSKFGLPTAEIYSVAKQVSVLPNLTLSGLMTIPPLSDDPESSRPYFCSLAKLQKGLTELGVEGVKYLSMGMSQDFEVAIEEGANFVRVGSAIFGPR